MKDGHCLFDKGEDIADEVQDVCDAEIIGGHLGLLGYDGHYFQNGIKKGGFKNFNRKNRKV